MAKPEAKGKNRNLIGSGSNRAHKKTALIYPRSVAFWRGDAAQDGIQPPALSSPPHQAITRERYPDQDKHASKHRITVLELDAGHSDPEDGQRNNNKQSHRVTLVLDVSV